MLDHLEWIYFRSPDWTWEQLCGREGWLLWDTQTKQQRAFIDELFQRAQERFQARPTRQHTTREAKRTYLFAGMVHCATGHQPLSMQGKARKGHHYYACSCGANYGDSAAIEAHADQKWIYLREDALLQLVEQFFEQRIFGPLRLDKLARQIKTQGREQKRNGKLLGTRLRHQVTEAERKIKVQVQASRTGSTRTCHRPDHGAESR